MSPFLFTAAANIARTTEPTAKRRVSITVDAALAEAFGDPFARALWRETAYAVPDSERTTCPVHQDWRSHCIDLHVTRPTA